MFSLLSGLWSYLFSPKNFHVLIVGLDSAGKTTLLENIKRKYGNGGLPNDKISPTIGMNLAKIKYRGSQMIFWDLGGQSKMRSMWEKYYVEANAVLFVVDSSDATRMKEANDALQTILQDPTLSDTPLLIVANKQDLQCALSVKEIHNTLFPSFATDESHLHAALNRIVFGVSAITSAGLEDCLRTVFDQCQLKNQSFQSKS